LIRPETDGPRRCVGPTFHSLTGGLYQQAPQRLRPIFSGSWNEQLNGTGARPDDGADAEAVKRWFIDRCGPGNADGDAPCETIHRADILSST